MFRCSLKAGPVLAGWLAAWATGGPSPAAADPGSEFGSGMFVYMADAAGFTECKTGRSYPVADDEDYLALERAYVGAVKEPGQPLMATLDFTVEDRPRMDGDGTEPTVVVARFVRLWPEETCERNRADASLTETYWRIVRLGDEEVSAASGRREPHVLLRAGEPRFQATVGCNQLGGSYEVEGQTLRFREVASTMMACVPPLDGLERRLGEALGQAAGWRIAGQVLELTDAEGRPLALLQAVYLR